MTYNLVEEDLVHNKIASTYYQSVHMNVPWRISTIRIIEYRLSVTTNFEHSVVGEGNDHKAMDM